MIWVRVLEEVVRLLGGRVVTIYIYIYIYDIIIIIKIMSNSLTSGVSDPSAPCGKMRLVKLASTNTNSTQTFHFRYELYGNDQHTNK